MLPGGLCSVFYMPAVGLPYIFRTGLSTSACLSRWYKKFFRLKKQVSVFKPPVQFEKDWEKKPYESLPSSSIPPSIECISSFKSLDESVKPIFSYEFASKELEFNDVLNAKLKELGYDPTDDNSTGAKIIRMTMRLRYKKKLFEEHPRNVTLLRATRCLISARRRTLRLLRSTNMPEFERLTKALEITGYLHPDPYDFGYMDETVRRKKATRAECYQIRLAKLANLKVRRATSEQEFYARKEETLENLLNDLALLESKDSDKAPDREKALATLQTLFREVVSERKNEVLKGPQDDQLLWYYKEEEEREKYARVQAEKAEKQLRRKKK
ncbi:unnamed protein product [Calicophoron daubneyi]|uniref:Small ribosomal subunit protein uS15m n=1 Tax=Calicophoron daubneyi TaxID=300641 RepID=A0AAV2T2M2_CALDB